MIFRATRSLMLVSAGYALRLVAGMFVFVLLTRTLGRDEFGRFTLWMAVTMLVSVPANYGFTTMVLRGFGARPEKAVEQVGEVLTAKLLLSSLVVAGLLLALPWFGAEERLLAPLLLAAQMFDSFGDLYNLGFRHGRHYAAEARTSVLTSALHILVLGASLPFIHTAVAAAAVFAASRLLVMLVVRWRSRRWFGPMRAAPLARAWAPLRAGWAYALELGLYTSYNQVDSVVINLFLGHSGVGLYQAGMKLVEGASRLAPVVAQLMLPTLASAAHADRRAFRGVAVRSIAAFAGFGLAGGLVLTFGAHLISHRMFGEQFAALEPLLPVFGLLLLMRYVETGAGLVLVALDLQHRKVWLVAAQLAFVLGGGSWALRQFGLAGWQWTVITSLALVLCGYAWVARERRIDARAHLGVRPIGLSHRPIDDDRAEELAFSAEGDR